VNQCICYKIPKEPDLGLLRNDPSLPESQENHCHYVQGIASCFVELPIVITDAILKFPCFWSDRKRDTDPLSMVAPEQSPPSVIFHFQILNIASHALFSSVACGCLMGHCAFLLLNFKLSCVSWLQCPTWNEVLQFVSDK